MVKIKVSVPPDENLPGLRIMIHKTKRYARCPEQNQPAQEFVDEPFDGDVEISVAV